MYADVAGYSRLTGIDEEGTHRRLSTYLDVVSEAIRSSGGRVVHYAGDAVLADFGSVVDAVGCAVANQKLPDGYYHLDRMVETVIRRGGEVGCCGTCLDARALPESNLVQGARRSSLEEATEWTLWADTVLSF